MQIEFAHIFFCKEMRKKKIKKFSRQQIVSNTDSKAKYLDHQREWPISDQQGPVPIQDQQ